MMGFRQVNDNCTGSAQVEISATLLAELIRSGALTGNNCKCLDHNARQTLWQSLLNLSANVMHANLTITEQ